MICTHNSCTYAKVKQWYLRPLSFTARCQEIPIKDQHDKYGVTLFDIRVRFDKNGTPYICHGLMRYDIDIFNILYQINQYRDSYVLVTLELSDSNKDYIRQNQLFVSFCRNIENKYDGIIFFGGNIKKPYNKVLYKFKSNWPQFKSIFSSVDDSIINDLYPKLYAKKHNKESYKLLPDTSIMIDFVNIK